MLNVDMVIWIPKSLFENTLNSVYGSSSYASLVCELTIVYR